MLAYVGGYTSKDRNGRGDGINVYQIDETTLTPTSQVVAVGSPSAIVFR
jgi:6-phosphogluconolactonase (cycloisomerase 2 family)